MERTRHVQHLVAAEAALSQMALRLAETQVAAILGLYYDDREYDRIILEHRRARAAVAAAQGTWLSAPRAVSVA